LSVIRGASKVDQLAYNLTAFCPYRVRDWELFFDPTAIFWEPSLVSVCMFCWFRKA
jgi:hypothetical protein